MKKYFQLRIYQVELWKTSALMSQEILLYDLIHLGEQTEFGRTHNFKNIETYEEFKRDVPIMTYEEIAPYITRMLDGESDVLWPGKVTSFSKSSGTTNDISKYIPVSHDSLYGNNYKAGRDLYSLFFKNYPDSDLFENNGSVFSLGGSFETNEHSIKIGDVSAIIMSELPQWAERYREPSIKTALMSHWKDKIPAMITETVGKNITHLSGVPTWFVALFEELQKTHPYTTLRDVWPNLELFVHGAVSFEPYRTIFQKLLPFDDMKYLEVYNASEGFLAIQDDPSKPGEMLLLTDHGIFYEFILMNSYGTKEPLTVTLSDVEVGVDYAVIITTNAGLWRYDIGDTVCFTSTEPYRIKISGRTKHFINVFGEELMVGNADEAMSHVCKQTGAIVEHYTAGPIFLDEHGRGGHEWVVEFKQEPRDIQSFITKLDQKLQSLNSDYAAKRQDDIALQELILHAVPQGTFIQWMESRGKLGAQHKVPKLSNKREYIEELLGNL
ncbi:GH3 auxin-responsive promoter family protein [Patescibacteria group bacterium]|nr:GH3 auxin-responsive promoter family protein [Patescibacteria group bacterium]